MNQEWTFNKVLKKKPLNSLSYEDPAEPKTIVFSLLSVCYMAVTLSELGSKQNTLYVISIFANTDLIGVVKVKVK